VVTEAKPAPRPAARREQPKPAPKGPNMILFERAGHLTLIDPDGKNERKVTKDRGKFPREGAKLSPDGKRVAVLLQEPVPPAGGQVPPKGKLFVRGLDEPEPGTNLGVECQLFFWSPDGAEIAYSDFEDGTDKPPESAHGIVNVATKAKTPLKLPADHVITDWSRDGKLFLTTSVDGPVTENRFPAMRLHLMNRDGTGRKQLTDGKQPAVFGRLSPDGSRVLFTRVEVKEVTPAEKKVRDEQGLGPPKPNFALTVLDVATGKTTPVQDLPLNGEIQGYCWSPDGKKVAYCWRVRHEVADRKELQEKETESHLVVCDPDGKNAKTIATEKAKGQWVVTIGQVDWR
jgi:Tol biopolymer transport system component